MRRLLALLLLIPGVLRAEAPPDVVVLCDPALCPAIREAGSLWRLSSRVPVRLFETPTALMSARLLRGARADLVAGLDPAALDAADRDGSLRPGTRRRLGADRLVLVRRAASPLPEGVTVVADAGLPGPGAESRAFAALAGAGTDPAGAENTPAVAAMVAEGRARAGVVFATDLRADPRLAKAPAMDGPVVVAEVATVKEPRSANTAAFRDFLLGPRGAGVLRAAGLEP